jgi:hypothetical protein
VAKPETKAAPLPATPGAKTPDEKTPGPVANGNPQGSAAPETPAVPAQYSVPLFGGYRGGRKRKDGLKPGSPEALQADRDANAKRMREKRAADSAAKLPAPLPAATPPTIAPMLDKTLPPAGGEVAGLAAPGLPVVALIQWQAGDLLPVTEAGVPLIEQMLGRSIVRKARRARIPDEIISEIEKDVAWPKASREMLIKTSDALAAKYLNKAGLSAEYKVEVNFGVAVLNIGALHMAVLKRLDKLIAASNAGAPPANPAPHAGRPDVP